MKSISIFKFILFFYISLFLQGSNDKTVKIWDLTGGSLNIDTEIIKPCTVLSHFGCGDLKVSSIKTMFYKIKYNIHILLLRVYRVSMKTV